MAKLFSAPLFLRCRSRYAKGMRRGRRAVRAFPWRSGSRAIDKSFEGKRAALPGSYRTYSPFAACPTDDLIYTSVLITIDFSPSAGETRPLYRRTDVASLSRTYVVSLFPSHSCADCERVAPAHMHGQAGRAGDFWSIGDRRPRSS